MATVGQQSLDKIRQAADLTDTHLANAMKTKGDGFDLDTQYARPAGLIAPPPASGMDCVNMTVGITGLTIAAHSKYFGCGSGGKHCKL